MHLPPLTITVQLDEMTASEFDFYESMYKQTKTKFDTYVDQGVLLNNYAHVFDLIMRLRQAVDHPYLIIHGLRKNEEESSLSRSYKLIPTKSRKPIEASPITNSVSLSKNVFYYRGRRNRRKWLNLSSKIAGSVKWQLNIYLGEILVQRVDTILVLGRRRSL